MEFLKGIPTTDPTRGAGVLRTVAREDLTCPDCDKTFDNGAGLSVHRTRVHGAISPTAEQLAARGKTGRFKCPTCAFRTDSKQGLASQVRKIHGGKAKKK